MASEPADGPPAPGPAPGETDAPLGDAFAADRALAAAILRRDRKAAAELVAGHIDAIFRYVRHRLAPQIDRVDDVVHDVFVAALVGLHAYRGTSPLRAWLLGIARHKVEDVYRQRLRAPASLGSEEDLTEAIADRPLVEERIDRARAAERTQQILLALPRDYSAALLWRYWENRSTREIAAATGRTEKAVERLLARARTRFRELWEEMP